MSSLSWSLSAESFLGTPVGEITIREQSGRPASQGLPRVSGVTPLKSPIIQCLMPGVTPLTLIKPFDAYLPRKRKDRSTRIRFLAKANSSEIKIQVLNGQADIKTFKIIDMVEKFIDGEKIPSSDFPVNATFSSTCPIVAKNSAGFMNIN